MKKNCALTSTYVPCHMYTHILSHTPMLNKVKIKKNYIQYITQHYLTYLHKFPYNMKLKEKKNLDLVMRLRPPRTCSQSGRLLEVSDMSKTRTLHTLPWCQLPVTLLRFLLPVILYAEHCSHTLNYVNSFNTLKQSDEVSVTNSVYFNKQENQSPKYS